MLRQEGNGKTPLADKLIASVNSAQSTNIANSKVTEMTEVQLREFVATAERSEKEWFDRVGRRLDTILEAVRDAKNVAKPVQVALAEAMTAFKQAGARKRRSNAVERLKNIGDDAGPRVVLINTAGVDAEPTEVTTTRGMLMDIVHEVKALRQEVSDFRSVRALSGDDAAKGETWVEVVKKKGKGNKVIDSTAALPPNKAPEARTRFLRPTVRQRPPAILIEAGINDFPTLVKNIRGNANREVIGDNVVGMRQTKAGGLLIELKGDQQQIEAVRAEVSRLVGAEIEVRSQQQKTMVEIIDLDQWTDSEEVAGAVAAETGVNHEALKVVSVRKRFGGTKAAMVLVPTVACQKMLSHGRIRVGLVNCRVRRGDPRTRCFRCHSYGHMAKECTGPDRSACCRRCGSPGHRAAGCVATSQETKEFERKLAGADESNGGSSNTTPSQ